MGYAWDTPPRIVGHRGAPDEAAENTLASFKAAHAAGARAVELDVRQSVDGEVIVHHDPELGRIIAGEGRIEDLPSDVLRAKGIPTLADVLALPLLVNVEIKSDADNASDLPRLVWSVVKRMGALERVLVTSFDPELADEYAGLSNRPAGAIYPFAPDAEDLEAFPRLTFLAIVQDAAIPEAIDSLVRAERTVLVWTVNDEANASALLRDGVSSLITDRPGPLMRSLAEGATAP